MDIVFSKEEQNVIKNADFFYHKKTAVDKIIARLNGLKGNIKTSTVFQNFHFLPEIDIDLGKISKGENYKGLPYLILDFPRFFHPKGIFAYRVMFWWGRGFYFTLHLSGVFLDFYKKALIDAFESLKEQEIFLYQNKNDEWQHEMEMPYFQLIDDCSKSDFEKWLDEVNFIKIGQKMPLERLSELENFGVNTFELLFDILKRQS
ncbi:MAG: hypothetical protein ACPG19_11365 [Saprospiraceae bacterium]